MHTHIVFWSFFFVICVCDSELREEAADSLIKFRDDINQISVDLENFVYDIVQESLAGSDKLLNPNYEINKLTRNLLKPPKSPKIMNTLRRQTSSLKENLKKYVPNGASDFINNLSSTTTPKSVLDNYLDNYIEKTSNLFSKNGLRRSRRNANLPEIIGVRNSDTSLPQRNDCSKQHVEDLKEEVQKLRDLILMLKEQKKIMTILDGSTRNATKNMDSEDIIKTKEQFRTDHENEHSNYNYKTLDHKHTNDELQKMKYDLLQTISTLNNTREILLLERDHEMALENELNRQKSELNILKIMVKDLYNNNHLNFSESQLLNGSSDINEVVGAPIHKLKENVNLTKGTRRMNSQQRNDNNHARANELSNLLEELDKKKREEDIKKLVAKFLEEKESKTLNSQTNDGDIIKNLQRLLKEQNKVETKSDDESILAELIKLDDAINLLRPVENKQSSIDVEKLKELVNGLSLPNKGGLSNGNDLAAGRALSPQEVFNLRRRLEQMSSSNGAADLFRGTGTGNFDMGSQHIDINRRGPVPYLHSAYPNGFGGYSSPFETFHPPPVNYPYGQSNPYDYLPPAVPSNFYPNENFESYKPSQTFQSNYGANKDQLDFRGKYGTNIVSTDINKPFDGTPYFDVNKPYGSNVGPLEYSKQYGMHFIPNTYGKPYADTQKIPASVSETPTSSDYSLNNANDHFFPDPQPNTYDKSVQNGVYPAENIDGSHSIQSGTYLPKNTYNVDYSTKNIEELKTQVNSLQNIINNLNYSGYKKPEDQQTIFNLEQQINDLKGIIHTLNQDMSSNPPSYNQIPLNYEQPNPAGLSNSRRKRSISDQDASSRLYDQTALKLKEYLFANNKEDINPYQEVQARINTIHSQTPAATFTKTAI